MPYVLLALVVGALLIFAVQTGAVSENISPSIGTSWAIIPPKLPNNAEPVKTLAATLTFAPFYGIDPRWIYWTAYLESKFVSDAVGDDGKAFGLCQIWKITAETVRENGYDLNPEWQTGIQANIQTACQYSQWLTRNFPISDAGIFRQVWVLGPDAYFMKGLRKESEGSALLTLVGA